MGCPIRTSADQRFFAAPRSFSQLGTSFIASVCLGIHRTLFSTFSLHGLHNHCANHTSHELDFVTSFDTLNLKESLLTGSPRITARTASIFILPQYVKELSSPKHPGRSQKNRRDSNPLATRPDYSEPPPALLLQSQKINLSKTIRGATGIRTPDPLLAKQVL
jgi:hypothetical protein